MTKIVMVKSLVNRVLNALMAERFKNSKHRPSGIDVTENIYVYSRYSEFHGTIPSRSCHVMITRETRSNEYKLINIV